MKKKKEQTFGEVIGPALSQIEDAIIDFHEQHPGDKPDYSDDSLRAAVCVFMDVATERMFDYLTKLQLEKEDCLLFADNFANEFRYFVLKYCDVALEKLLK